MFARLYLDDTPGDGITLYHCVKSVTSATNCVPNSAPHSAAECANSASKLELTGRSDGCKGLSRHNDQPLSQHFTASTVQAHNMPNVVGQSSLVADCRASTGQLVDGGCINKRQGGALCSLAHLDKARARPQVGGRSSALDNTLPEPAGCGRKTR